MRFSGSIYDNLRQPGVFAELQEMFGKKKDKAVLARLRFDDLMTNDSYDISDARIVLSFTDILDGRLFTLIDPEDLKGINFEILCPKVIADNPEYAVPRMLRSWIQYENGKGRPGWFKAVEDDFTPEISNAISKMKDLDIQKIDHALKVARNAGYSPEKIEELGAHWKIWDENIRKQKFYLTQFHKNKAASAVTLLDDFLKENRNKMHEWGIFEKGTQVFSESLGILRDSGGRRDATVKLIDERYTESNGTDRDEIKMVKAIFFHYMFAVIVEANKSNPEFSDSVGEDDDYAFPTNYFDKIELPEEEADGIELDAQIVSGLGGDLSVSDYVKVKKDTVPQIRKGMENFKKNGDKSDLRIAFKNLADKVIDRTHVVSESARRRIIWTSAGGVVISLAMSIVTSNPVPVIAAISSTVVSGISVNVEKSLSKILLKKSLIRIEEKRLRKYICPLNKRIDTDKLIKL